MTDGSHHHGMYHWKFIPNLPIWRWLWLNVLGLPLAKSKILNRKDFSSSKSYIFGFHPHGIFSFQHIALLVPSLFEDSCEDTIHNISPMDKRRDLCATILFTLPGLRELSLWSGNVDASRATAQGILKRGYDMGIVVGGEQEQLRSQMGEEIAYVKDRKGFVKLALQQGRDIVPVYTFGENNLYYQFQVKIFANDLSFILNNITTFL